MLSQVDNVVYSIGRAKKERILFQELLSIMFDILESRRDSAILHPVIAALALMVDQNRNKGVHEFVLLILGVLTSVL